MLARRARIPRRIPVQSLTPEPVVKPAPEIQHLTNRVKMVPVLPLTFPLFRSAVLLQRRYRISYWDAAILTATKAIGATTLYSEDLSHGQVYDGVRVVNPFLEMGVQAPPPSP